MPRISVVIKLDSSINKQFCIISAGFLFCNAKKKLAWGQGAQLVKEEAKCAIGTTETRNL